MHALANVEIELEELLHYLPGVELNDILIDAVTEQLDKGYFPEFEPGTHIQIASSHVYGGFSNTVFIHIVFGRKE